MSRRYEAPTLNVLGSVVELTQGIKFAWGVDCNFPASKLDEYFCWRGS